MQLKSFGTLQITKKLIFTILLVILIFASIKYYKTYYIHYKFNKAIEYAANIPSQSWDKNYKDMKTKNSYKVVIITNYGGEHVYSEYFKYVAEKMGWNVKIFYKQTLGHEQEILDFDPDFIIMTILTNPDYDTRIIAHKSKKYLLNLSSLQRSKGLKGTGKFKNSNSYRQIGYLADLIPMVHAVLVTPLEVDMYRKMFQEVNKEFNGIGLLPLAPDLKDKNLICSPKNLMVAGAGWDPYRTSNDYTKFITLLSNNIPMKAYGPLSNKAYSHLPPHVYDGYIGPSIENLNAINKNGIYLLTHSNLHFIGKDPSMRLFEAVAANAVVISDMHPFAIENFGDTFLYFDQTADAESMYSQVKAHYDWIKANPEKAKAMADRAHKIFLEKFTLEKDLERIAKMHEYLLEQDKKIGLSYPLAY